MSALEDAIRSIISTAVREAIREELAPLLEELRAAKSQPPSAGEWLNPKQAAALMSVAVNTLARLRMHGDGPPYIKRGKGKQAAIRYGRSDLEAWMASHARRSTSG